MLVGHPEEHGEARRSPPLRHPRDVEAIHAIFVEHPEELVPQHRAGRVVQKLQGLAAGVQVGPDPGRAFGVGRRELIHVGEDIGPDRKPTGRSVLMLPSPKKLAPRAARRFRD